MRVGLLLLGVSECIKSKALMEPLNCKGSWWTTSPAAGVVVFITSLWLLTFHCVMKNEMRIINGIMEREGGCIKIKPLIWRRRKPLDSKLARRIKLQRSSWRREVSGKLARQPDATATGTALLFLSSVDVLQWSKGQKKTRPNEVSNALRATLKTFLYHS